MTNRTIDGISLIGIRLSYDSTEPELYTLVTYGAEEKPLVVNGRLILFTSAALSEKAYDLFDDRVKSKVVKSAFDLRLVCDVAGMLHLINHRDVDDAAIIVNCLNTAFDFVAATNVVLPDKYRSLLFRLADHLTFDHEFASYLDKNGIDRSTITEAVLWCIGAITIRAKVIR